MPGSVWTCDKRRIEIEPLNVGTTVPEQSSESSQQLSKTAVHTHPFVTTVCSPRHATRKKKRKKLSIVKLANAAMFSDKTSAQLRLLTDTLQGVRGWRAPVVLSRSRASSRCPLPTRLCSGTSPKKAVARPLEITTGACDGRAHRVRMRGLPCHTRQNE